MKSKIVYHHKALIKDTPQGHHYHIDENVFTYEFMDED